MNKFTWNNKKDLKHHNRKGRFIGLLNSYMV
jgi:hypothetical protein